MQYSSTGTGSFIPQPNWKVLNFAAKLNSHFLEETAIAFESGGEPTLGYLVFVWQMLSWVVSLLLRLLYRHTCVAFGVISSFSILCIGRRAFDLFLSGGHGVCETDRDHPSQKRGLCDFWGARRVRIIGTNLCAKNANRVARKSSAAAEMDFPVGWSLITFLPNTRRRLLKIIKCS